MDDLLGLLLEVTFDFIIQGTGNRSGKKKKGTTLISEREREVIALVTIIIGMHYYDDKKISRSERKYVKDFLKQSPLKLSTKSTITISKLRYKKLDIEDVKAKLINLNFDSVKSIHLVDELRAPVSLLANRDYDDYLIELKKRLDLNSFISN